MKFLSSIIVGLSLLSSISISKSLEINTDLMEAKKQQIKKQTPAPTPAPIKTVNGWSDEDKLLISNLCSIIVQSVGIPQENTDYLCPCAFDSFSKSFKKEDIMSKKSQLNDVFVSIFYKHVTECAKNF